MSTVSELISVIYMLFASVKGEMHFLIPVGTQNMTKAKTSIHAHIDISSMAISSSGMKNTVMTIERHGLAQQTVDLRSLSSNELTIATDFLHENDKAPVMVVVDTAASSLIAKYVTVADGESCLLLPESALGKEYYVVTQCLPYGYCHVAVGSSGMTVQTSVTIELPESRTGSDVEIVYNNRRYGSGDVITEILDGFEVMHVSCACDLTGTRITGNNKLAVYAGSSDVVNGKSGKKSFLIEQLLPIQRWGNLYYATPFPKSHGGATVRIIAAHNETNVSFTGYRTVRLNEGQWISRKLHPAAISKCTSTKPVMAVLFNTHELSTEAENVSTTMITLPPGLSTTDQYQFSTLLQTCLPGRCNLITTSQAYHDLILNGLPMVTTANSYLIHDDLVTNFIDLTQEDNVVQSHINLATYMVTYDETNTTYGNMIGGQFDNSYPIVYPMYPGDMQDNDGNGMIDDEDCTPTQPQQGDDCGRIISGILDNFGVKFDISFLNLKIDVTDNQLAEIYITSKQSTTVTVTISYRSINNVLITRTLDVVANGVLKVELPSSLVADSNATSTSAITVSADKEISLHGMTTTRTMLAAFLALPRDALGREYYAMTHCPTGYCRCVVNSVYNDTTVKVTFSSLPENVTYRWGGQEFHSHEYFEVLLHEGDTFGLSLDNDLTGTKITGTYPVAVFCGGITDTGTFLEQMIPFSFYNNRKHFSMPLSSNEDKYMIKAITNTGDANCKITTTTGVIEYQHYLSLPGDFMVEHLPIEPNTTATVRCTNPANVFLISDNERTDGFMTILVSRSSYEASYMFPNLVNPGAQLWYVSLTAKSDTNSDAAILVSEFPTSTLVPASTRTLNAGDTKDGITFTSSSDIILIEVLNGTYRDYVAVYSMAKSQDLLVPQEYVTNLATPVGMLFHEPAACTPTPSWIDDGIDNDCDGKIDEEVCIDMDKYDESAVKAIYGTYIPDQDLDGAIAEDCGKYLDGSITTVGSVQTTNSLTTDGSANIITQLVTTQVQATMTMTSSGSVSLTTRSVTTDRHQTTTPAPLWTTDITVVNVKENTTKCECECYVSNPVNYTKEELKIVLHEIKKNLTLNKKTLTSSKMKKISAPDNRPSAVAIGSCGVVMIVIFFAVLVAADIQFYIMLLRKVVSAFKQVINRL